MDNSFINIIPSKKDLPDVLESWKECTCKEKIDQIVEFSIKERGCPPAFNMLFIKEVIFDIPKTIELHHLFALKQKLADKFKVYCFQISIDRKNGQAHMLFDFYNRESNQCTYLYDSKMYQFCVVVIQTLDLKVPQTDIRWLRYFLKEEYDLDKEVFDKLDAWLRHQNPSPRNYQVFHNVLSFVKHYCEGVIR